MKKLFAAFAFAALALPLAVQADDEKKVTKGTQTIADIVVANKDFSTLLTAVKAADLVDALKGEGPITVFAPNNAAFDKVGKEKVEKLVDNKELLTKVLEAHIIKGKAVMAKDVIGMKGQKVNGYTVEVDGDDVMLVRGNTKVKVLKADIKAKNGVIHVIDTVLQPAGKGGKGKGKGGSGE